MRFLNAQMIRIQPGLKHIWRPLQLRQMLLLCCRRRGSGLRRAAVSMRPVPADGAGGLRLR